nr:MAG TPA: hypothetical protein [Caudoviricetes sp.]
MFMAQPPSGWYFYYITLKQGGQPFAGTLTSKAHKNAPVRVSKIKIRGVQKWKQEK